jgi:predicted N-acyltransferase
VAEAGISFEVVPGRVLSEAEWDHVYALYVHTYHERGQAPYFSREFLADSGRAEGLDMRLIFAVHAGRRVAVAITLIGGDTLYGRHWGAEAHYHSLHFECCYYQGIELCLREGLRRFDAGTQGAHKHGRGFEPVRTRSFHRLADPRLHEAVADYLARERRMVSAREAEFMHHTAYRADPSGAGRT